VHTRARNDYGKTYLTIREQKKVLKIQIIRFMARAVCLRGREKKKAQKCTTSLQWTCHRGRKGGLRGEKDRAPSRKTGQRGSIFVEPRGT